MDIAAFGIPTVTIDLDVVDTNLRRMAEYCRRSELGLRPHTRTHKIPELSSRQIQFGEMGLAVAKPENPR
jgi:3-hydroxy-D-aspartate aldolase